jgi:hypothetical protein
MDLCSAMTRARAMEGTHSINPSSAEVGNTLQLAIIADQAQALQWGPVQMQHGDLSLAKA